MTGYGLTGGRFLDHFQTVLYPGSGVVVVNAEMTRDDYLCVWRDLRGEPPEPVKVKGREYEITNGHGEKVGSVTSGGLKSRDPYQRLRFMHCRDDRIRINFLSERHRSSFVDWCEGGQYLTEWLFLDPWKELCAWAGVSPNDGPGVMDLLNAIRDVGTRLMLTLTVIPMHTPQTRAEDGWERAKGAGELEDGVDVMWRYTRSGPGAAARVLAAEGRSGILVEETAVYFDSATGLLTLGSGDRVEVRRSAKADKVFALIQETPGIKSGELRDKAGGDERDTDKAVRWLLNEGKVCQHKGLKNANLHYETAASCPNPDDCASWLKFSVPQRG